MPYFSNPKINATTNMKYNGVLTIAYLYQEFHNAHTHKLRITRVHITTNKIYNSWIESKSTFIKYTKWIWVVFNLRFARVTGMDRRGSAGWRKPGARLRTANTWLRRTPATNGTLRRTPRAPATNGTSVERGALEREASSSREEGRGLSAFYREREGNSLPGSFNGALLSFMAITSVSYKENNGGGMGEGVTDEIKHH